MARVQGPAVEALAITFLEDWELETGEGVERLAARPATPTRSADGRDGRGPGRPLGAGRSQGVDPGRPADGDLRRPARAGADDPVLRPRRVAAHGPGLGGAAGGGGHPGRPGAGRFAAGPARQPAAQGRARWSRACGSSSSATGLLHTKSVTVDGELSLFGSLNLDPRSLVLNFEITLAVYDAGFTAELRALQQSYIDRASPVDMAAWKSRRPLTRLVEDSARLISPLL